MQTHKSLIASSALIATLAFAGQASADPYLALGFDVGSLGTVEKKTNVEYSTDVSPIGGLALGFEWDTAPDVRIEAEFTHAIGSVDKVNTGYVSDDSISLTTAGVNGFIDIPLINYTEYSDNPFPQLEWYVGAGVGVAVWNANVAGPNGASLDLDNENGSYWQVLTGLAVEWENGTTLFAGLRHRETGGVGTDSNGLISNSTTTLQAGIRLPF